MLDVMKTKIKMAKLFFQSYYLFVFTRQSDDILRRHFTDRWHNNALGDMTWEKVPELQFSISSSDFDFM